ncbi:MAG: outer membrane beta-barrel protein [Candidatus Eremiobacteraeota bacterium]|nr:outer membrane beta-barrel protein [Candidatus Eremiobacteraeota bacterium]
MLRTRAFLLAPVALAGFPVEAWCEPQADLGPSIVVQSASPWREVDWRAVRNQQLTWEPVESSPLPESTPPPEEATAPTTRKRRAKPQPLDDVFALNEYIGPTIGVPDTTPIYPLNEALWDAIPALKDADIRVYGWVNPSVGFSSSRESNFPLSYNVQSNSVMFNQGVIRVERPVDTVQTDHWDVGFRATMMYGSDYRFTTAKGMFSNQLLNNNQLYGFDPVELYAQVYIPEVADGMVLTLGRYISPADIEAQTSPSNLLFTHSLMFTVDPYTFTGVKADIKLDDNWSMMFQVHGGNDVVVPDKASRLNGGAMVRWVSDDNNDSIWAGVNAINGSNYNVGSDQLNHFVGTWSHKFNDDVNMMTEVYYEYFRNGLTGGRVNYGPPISAYRLTGPGTPIPGEAGALGIVSYTNFKVSDQSYFTFRADYLNDPVGMRTGFGTAFGSLTLGYTHRFSPLITIRPEIRYEKAFRAGVTPYDNGRRADQTSFSMDAILRF